MSLTRFLSERIAEDEAEARRVGHPISGRDDLWTLRGPFDPDRILAQCEAKRLIVDELQHEGLGPRVWLLKVLAQPYADHPDFDESWRV